METLASLVINNEVIAETGHYKKGENPEAPGCRGCRSDKQQLRAAGATAVCPACPGPAALPSASPVAAPLPHGLSIVAQTLARWEHDLAVQLAVSRPLLMWCWQTSETQQQSHKNVSMVTQL
ncbi:hypothetical protein MG293_003981 [Ovis ammon polii]|uniref:Uncharacterized protein n=1 Tax=Ovis ammon polii TaxID=230172 RepID=A0AAD4ULJ0_OVIAM|nr:hypothetical protein MG293_003981 [Ovis ammon polii]